MSGKSEEKNSEKPVETNHQATMLRIVQMAEYLYSVEAVEVILISGAAGTLDTEAVQNFQLDPNGSWLFVHIPGELDLDALEVQRGQLMALPYKNIEKIRAELQSIIAEPVSSAEADTSDAADSDEEPADQKIEAVEAVTT